MTTTAYHVTSRANAMSILKEGFQGDYGDAGFGVYLWTCEAAAQDYAEQGGWDGSLKDAVIVEVELPENDLEMVDPDPNWPNPEDYENVALVRLEEFDDEARWAPTRMIAEEDGSYVLELSVAKLRGLCDPIQMPPWFDDGLWVTPGKVRDAYERGDFYDGVVNDDPNVCSELHAQRIAYHMKFGWDDAITLEIADYNDWPLNDGNHRFFAAILREDEGILVAASGDWEKIRALRPDPQPAAPALTL